ncbi:MAG: cbb3-type cytochrome oxidase subunit 3 [Paraglaciecola sp.]|jgi:cbb3-type cytochrome oxidase subunit 3
MAPLSELKDIHLPDAIGFWPLAYGWWLLLMVIILGVGWGIALWRKNHHRGRAKRQALLLLADINATQPTWPGQLNTLLKRLAMVYFPKHQVSKLYGNDWRIFLVSQLPDKKQTLFAEKFNLLQTHCYQPASTTQLDFNGCVEQIRTWIKYAVPPSKKVQPQEQQPHV